MTYRRIVDAVAEVLRNGYTSTDTEATVLAQVAIEAHEVAKIRFSTLDQPCRFIVKGRGVFPADQLRHDRCWPVDGDINAVTNCLLALGSPYEVVLCAQSRRAITPARWASFGWTITEIDGEEVKP